MKINKKKRLKKMIISLLIITILFLGISILTNYLEYRQYQIIVNNVINDIIKENDELEVINKLNNKDKANMLSKYNFNKEASYISLLNDEMNKALIINSILYLVFYLIILFIYLIEIKSLNKEINEISLYLKDLNQGNYFLKIDENREDGLSILKNEIYKTSVSLKENAVHNLEVKQNLANSLADISHQIKTPLTSINIILDNLKDNPKMNKKTRIDFINDLSKQVNNINYLTISLLKLAKFDAGTIIFKKEEIEVNKLFKEIKKDLSLYLEIEKATLEIEDTNYLFIGDYHLEKEAFTNIIKNGAENASLIKVSFISNALYLKIIIEDNGKGISKEDVHHLFDRFYTKVNDDKHFGIGLNLSKNIIEKDNGFISVKSIINKGTTFTIKFLR